MAFSPEEVDTERFIELVKAHPEIWDIGSEEHKDRRRKDAAWEEVARGMLEDYEDKGEMEKNEIVKKFASKWRNIRDTYAKSEKKRSSIGQPSTKVRRYIYAKQLAFLQYSTVPAASQSNNENEIEGAKPNETREVRNSEDNDVHTTTKPKRRSFFSKQRRRAFESFHLKCQNLPSSADLPDEDRAFFDSLLPSVRKLNEDQKLDFRCEVLNVLKKIKRGSAYQVQLALSQQSYPQRQYRYLPSHNFTTYAQTSPYPSLHSTRHKRTEKTPSHNSDSVGSNASQSPTPSEWLQTSSEEE